MIVDIKKSDILKCPLQHIVFAVNTSGWNGAGFAGVAVDACGGWEEINSGAPLGLGAVFTHSEMSEYGPTGRTFHAIVTHGPDEGWVPETITQGMNLIALRLGLVRVAVVLMGAGMIGQMSGADVLANLGAMARSRLEVEVYSL